MKIKFTVASILILFGMLSAMASINMADQQKEDGKRERKEKKEKREKKQIQRIDKDGNAEAMFSRGGIRRFQMWVNEQIEYPEQARVDGISGEVQVSFIVEVDGSVRIEKIVSSPSKILSDEVVRVIEMSPAWLPALRGGEPVPTRYTIPYLFKSNDERIGWDNSRPRIDKSLRGY